MFKQARIKLTAWYLVIIMGISIFFSLIIYRGASLELKRIEYVQSLRRPAGVTFAIEPEIIEETKNRVILTLIAVNGVILGIAGVAGYFLAGRTLDPIKKNMDEQKEFVSNASHELRTPLTSLKTEIEVALRAKQLSAKLMRETLQSNLEEVNKIQALSNYLLKLSRFEDQKLHFEMKNVDLKKVALSAIGKRKVKAEVQKTIVWGNEDLLLELVQILLDNAFKYSGPNPAIIVRTKNKTLEVEDKGVGIAPEDLPFIFDRFYRGDKSRTKDGYGLGLSIAKSIAELHGGKISAVSKLHEGSLFKVNFS